MSPRWRCSYTPGPHLAVVTTSVLAIAAADGDDRFSEVLTDAIERDLAWADLLGELSSSGFAKLPSLAVVRFEDGLTRVVVRGSGVVTSMATGGSIQRRDATGVSTWSESIVADVAEVSLSLGGFDPNWSGRLGEGVVFASALRWGAAAGHGATPSDSVRAAEPPAPPTETSAAAAPVVERANDPGELSPTPSSVPEEDPAGADGEPVPPEPTQEPAPESAGEPTAVAPSPPVVSVVSDGAPAASSVSGPSPATPSVAGSSPTPSRGFGAHDDDLDMSNLVDHTVVEGIEAAAVRPTVRPVEPEPEGVIESVPASSTQMWADGVDDDEDDGDGNTVVVRSSAGPSATPSFSPVAVGSSSRVAAVFCRGGHPNPPAAVRCRSCGADVPPGEARSIPRPSLGVLRFSTGDVVVVQGPLLIGRSAPNGQTIGDEVAAAVVIDAPDLSRIHAALHVEGWAVHAEDLNSSNGTFIELPGVPARRLRSGERPLLPLGAVVRFGAGPAALSCEFVGV